MFFLFFFTSFQCSGFGGFSSSGFGGFRGSVFRVRRLQGCFLMFFHKFSLFRVRGFFKNGFFNNFRGRLQGSEFFSGFSGQASGLGSCRPIYRVDFQSTHISPHPKCGVLVFCRHSPLSERERTRPHSHPSPPFRHSHDRVIMS